VLNLRTPIFLLLLATLASLVSCHSASAGPAIAPEVSRATLSIQPTVWAQRDRNITIVPRTVTRLQIVITRGWTRSEHLAWVIAEGSRALAVYRTNTAELGDVFGELSDLVASTTGTPLDQLSYTIMGSFKQPPPPPPPDPGGLPEMYVREVMRTAWSMDQEAVRFDRVLAP
jgi:hypothetical protein